MYSAARLALVLVSVLTFTACSTLKQKVASVFLEPGAPFDQTVAPMAPDYATPAAWAALPDKKDLADVVPKGDYKDGQENAKADVFYIHPTTFVTKLGWNQPIAHENANLITDYWVMRNQASIFNDCCRVYAPRYRQATLFSFFTDEESGKQALDLAYQDVKDAFSYYLEHHNNGRPIIIASHSQGSYHGIRLLEDMVFNKPVKDQLVAAYIIGAAIPEDKFNVPGGTPLCASPEQTGCAVAWNAVGPKADNDRFLGVSRKRFPEIYQANPEAKVACVNPLTWRHDGKSAHKQLNLGALHYPGEFSSTLEGSSYSYEEEAPAPIAGLFDAKCENGVLIVSTDVDSPYTEQPFGKQNYHMYDYDFFHMNIRDNADTRLSHFFHNDESHSTAVAH